MNSLNNILTNCSLFYNINPADFSSLLTCIHSYTKKYQPDEYIFLSGDQINYVGIILSGSIEIGKEELGYFAEVNAERKFYCDCEKIKESSLKKLNSDIKQFFELVQI